MAFTLIRYSQMGPRWKDDRRGKGLGSQGDLGCAVASSAMYTSGWGFIQTPGSLNQRLKSVGRFFGQAIVWRALGRLYPQIQFTALAPCGSSPAPTPLPPPASEPRKFQVMVVRQIGPLGLAVRAAPSHRAAKIGVEKAGYFAAEYVEELT